MHSTEAKFPEERLTIIGNSAQNDRYTTQNRVELAPRKVRASRLLNKQRQIQGAASRQVSAILKLSVLQRCHLAVST